MYVSMFMYYRIIYILYIIYIYIYHENHLKEDVILCVVSSS